MTLREILAAEGYDVLSGTKVIDYRRLQQAVMLSLAALYHMVDELADEHEVTVQEAWEEIVSPEIQRERDCLVNALNKLTQWANVDDEIGQRRRRLERKWLSRC